MKTLGERIKEVRKNAGLSQKELADKLGIASQSVNNYEMGHRIPDADILNKIVITTGCDPAWLLTGEPEKPQGVAEEQAAYGDPETTEILRLLKESPHDKKLVLKLLKARKEMKEALEGLGGTK